MFVRQLQPGEEPQSIEGDNIVSTDSTPVLVPIDKEAFERSQAFEDSKYKLEKCQQLELRKKYVSFFENRLQQTWMLHQSPSSDPVYHPDFTDCCEQKSETESEAELTFIWLNFIQLI